MKKVVIEIGYDIDIIEVPDDIAESIKKYQKLFDKWLHDKDNNHGHWRVIDGRKRGVCFDTITFVEYLNSKHLDDRDEKAIILEKKVHEVPKGIPTIFF